MAPTTEKPKAGGEKVTLYLEAHPKAVRRALRAKPDPGNVAAVFTDVEIHRSDPKAEEHGNTTVTFRHNYDSTELQVFTQRFVKKANAENEILFGDGDDDFEEAA